MSIIITKDKRPILYTKLIKRVKVYYKKLLFYYKIRPILYIK